MLDSDPLWYKDAIIYEVHVRAFHDAVGDGVGDFRGLTQKLDYLEDLGITTIWLLPFYPSPLKDDGYDIADYRDVHPNYGKLADFKEFLDEAHRRGIRVITELVINHTSDQHPWFQRARLAPPGSVERNFYVWSDTPERYKQARIIFKDFEPSNWSYDRVAQAYYWHRFYHHQPDLNFDNPAVWQALFPLLDFWLDMGVDGMRLDAIPYLYEREGTSCENLPETHVFLKALRQHLDQRYQGRMFLAEANQWPEDAVAYFGQGDECHMAFHFPVMPRLFMALHQEDRFPILDILAQTPAIHETCQWCLFLRNHDELTLEMVTDEERDYMYRAYAEDSYARINLGIRRRLAPLLRNDRRRIELMKALLFSLPGTPVIYYGDEIGMGDNIYLGDRNGVRTPMQWSADRNAGFSRANPQRLYLPVTIDPEYHYEAINVEAQQNNSSSLLWWMKRLIALRKRFKAFGRGSIRFLEPANPKVLAFLREYENERVLIVANLSRFVQHVDLEMPELAGLVPEELFGSSLLPAIGERPYPLILGPHGFYWFSLTPPRPSLLTTIHSPLTAPAPVLVVRGGVEELFQNSNLDRLEALLPGYLQKRRHPDAVEAIKAARVLNVSPVNMADRQMWFLVVELEFREGIPETVSLPLTVVPPGQEEHLLEPVGLAGLARLQGAAEGILCDAITVPSYCQDVLRTIAAGAAFRVEDGEVVCVPLPGLAELLEEKAEGGRMKDESEEGRALDSSFLLPPSSFSSAPVLSRSDRNNVTIRFGTRVIYKSFRRLEEGVHPDLELGRFLTERTPFTGLAPVVGYVEYRRKRRRSAPSTLVVLHRFVPNQGTAWQLTLDHLASYFEQVAALSHEQAAATPDVLGQLIGSFPGTAWALGQRTAQMHRALGSATDDAAFTPEPFARLYQRSLYQSLRNLAGRLRPRLTREKSRLPESARLAARELISAHDRLLERFQEVLDPALTSQRIRCHGDYHLGQLLFTGNDFVVIDFEGDPGRTTGERRVKRSPLRDVATLVRSLDYAVESVLLGLATGKGRPPGLVRHEDRATLAVWADAWRERISAELVTGYLEAMRDSGLLPATDDASRKLLNLLVLEAALLQIESELNNRPDWAQIPLQTVLRLLGLAAPAARSSEMRGYPGGE